MGSDGSGTLYAQTLPVLLLAVAGSFVAGIVLSSGTMQQAIHDVPGILLVLPAFLATKGNVFGAMGARIATALHQGVIEPEFTYNRRLRNAVVAAVINSVAVTAFIAISGWATLWLTGAQAGSLLRLVAILVIAGFLSSITIISILVTGLFIGFRHGIDPDVLSGPLITSTGDLLGMGVLAITIQIITVVL